MPKLNVPLASARGARHGEAMGSDADDREERTGGKNSTTKKDRGVCAQAQVTQRIKEAVRSAWRTPESKQRTPHRLAAGGAKLRLRTRIRVKREFAIYQALLGWKTYRYYYGTDELPYLRPTQPKKK